MGSIESEQIFIGRQPILDQLSLDDEITDALLSHGGRLGKLLLLTECLEQGDFEQAMELCEGLGISAKQVFMAELEASSWVCELSEALSG